VRSKHPLRCPIPALRGPSGDAPGALLRQEPDKADIKFNLNPPCGELTILVNVGYRGKSLWIVTQNWK